MLRSPSRPCIRRHGMRYFSILSLSLSLCFVAKAQQSVCPALPTKPPVPAGNTGISPNQAAMAAFLNGADMAARKQKFEQEKAKLDADPNVQAQRTKHLQMLTAAVNEPDFQKKKLDMANQIAAAQSSASFQTQKAKFQADLKCTGK